MYIPWHFVLGLFSPSQAPSMTSGQPTETTIHLPSHRPSFALPVSPYLAGFSIEMDRWPDWAGPEVGEPNLFFNQLLENLVERTGAPSSIRIGADSEDRAHVDLSYQVGHASFPPASDTIPVPEASSIAIGRDWYALSSNLPVGTRLTWGLNLKLLNVTETVQQASLLADSFQGRRADSLKHILLENVEIGNEPDLYHFSAPGFGKRWTPHNFTERWKEHAQAVKEVLELGNSEDDGRPTFWTGSFTIIEGPTPWTPKAIVESGIVDDEDLREVTSTYCDHHYNGVFGRGGPLAQPGDLMEKMSIRANLSLFAENIRVVKAEGLKYVLGETSSYANHGSPGTSNTAEAAIWAVDYILGGASIGIDRFYLSNGVGYRYNLLQPVPHAPDDGLGLTDRAHVLPIYHAFLVINEAIGKSKGSHVAEISTVDSGLAVYGVWDGTQLRRLVLINSKVYLPHHGSRQSIEVRIDGWKEGQRASIKRLHTPYTDAHRGLTWANQSFETRSGAPSGKVFEEKMENNLLSIEASSVVLVTFQD